MNSSVSRKIVGVGLVKIVRNVDDYTETIYNNIVYPGSFNPSNFNKIVGSEPNNINGLSDVQNSNGSDVGVDYETFIDEFYDIIDDIDLYI
jgi:hypothetical protein